jgi:hypothetical protein
MDPRRFARAFGLALFLFGSAAAANPPIYIAFHWHMHQPIYWPGENLVTTADSGRYGFSVLQVHTDRAGPYTSWPKDAVGAAMAAGLESCGASVSFSGSLMENLNAIEAAGRGFSGWKSVWQTTRSWSTVRGNLRIDLVDFGYFHPLMPLIEPRDVELQIRLHRQARDASFGARASKGIFTPEAAFHPRLVPTLAALGIQWVLVDNIHFDRARVDYPYTAASNLMPPNGAEVQNPPQPGAWVQLQNIWAPSKVSAPWGYRPHRVRYRDPESGVTSEIIAVPAARYEGNEDARGGFGALQYESVLSQYEAYNTDPQRPMLVVLHHDGDNYGGGTDSYYHGNWSQFLSWLQANPQRFRCTTVQDYLDQFPPPADDVIHVEPGSWSGADNGDAEFLKWNGKPNPSTGYSPDRQSWAVVTAARNWVRTAESRQPITDLSNVRLNTGNATERAWHDLLLAETSCYWYWDGNEPWDSHPTRAANSAIAYASQVVSPEHDSVGPTLYPPQRRPYNPGAIEWGTTVEPSDFEVWTLVYDLSGLSRVTLRYRVDPDGVRSEANEIYQGGTWVDLPMVGEDLPAPMTTVQPTHRARLYRARVTGLSQKLVDYYVEAQDTKGNVTRSPIDHVYVGQLAPWDGGSIPLPDAGPPEDGGLPQDGGPLQDGGAPADGGTPTDGGPPADGGAPADGGTPADGGSLQDGGPQGPPIGHWPESPQACERVTVWADRNALVHWGVNGWQMPPTALWPPGTAPFGDHRAVETSMVFQASGRYEVTLGPFEGLSPAITRVDYVIHYRDGTWSAPPDRVILIQAECSPRDGGAAPDGGLAPDGGAIGDGGSPLSQGACGCAFRVSSSEERIPLGMIGWWLVAIATMRRRRVRSRGILQGAGKA